MLRSDWSRFGFPKWLTFLEITCSNWPQTTIDKVLANRALSLCSSQNIFLTFEKLIFPSWNMIWASKILFGQVIIMMAKFIKQDVFWMCFILQYCLLMRNTEKKDIYTQLDIINYWCCQDDFAWMVGCYRLFGALSCCALEFLLSQSLLGVGNIMAKWAWMSSNIFGDSREWSNFCDVIFSFGGIVRVTLLCIGLVKTYFFWIIDYFSVVFLDYEMRV